MAKIKELFSIDSLKLRIPFNQVEILNESILDEKTKIIVSNVSGEIISEDKIKSLTTEIKFNDYLIKVAIIQQHNFQSKQTE